MKQTRKEVVAIVGFYLPGIYPAGDDSVVSDLLAPALLKATADADPDIAARYDIRRFNFPTTMDSAEAARHICEARPVLVAYSVYIWNYLQTMQCSRLTKQSLPDVPVIMGGPQVMYRASEEMQKHPQIDAIVYGNGELRFRQLLKGAFSPEGFEQIARITYRDHQGRIRETQGGIVEDVSQIPSPYQTGVVDLNDGQRHTVFIETFRGCPFKCGYCVWGDNNVKIHKIDLDRILDDIEIIYNNPNVEVVYFTDACLFYTRQRAKAICDKIASCSREIPTVMTLDIRTLTEETIASLSQLTLIRNQFHLGLQSTNPKALEALNRKTAKDVFVEKIDLLRRLQPGAQISLDLIYGLPQDNFERFRESVDFAYSLSPGKLYLSHLLLLPGTPFWDHRDALGFDYTDEPPYMVRSNPQFTPDDMARTMAWVMWIQVMNYFGAIKDAVLRIREYNQRYRYIDLIDRLIEIVRAQVDPVSELQHEFTIESQNANRRYVMNTFAEPENGLILYEATRQLLVECGVESRLGQDINLGIQYYRSLCYDVGQSEEELLAAHGRQRIEYVQAKWRVSTPQKRRVAPLQCVREV